MTGQVNRVNDELADWKEQEKVLTRLFPEQVRSNRDVIKNAVSFYKSILDKYKLTKDPVEQRTLIMVKALKRELENKLYPSLLDKIFKKIRDLISPAGKQETQEIINLRNETKLRQELVRRGFGDMLPELSHLIRLNKPEFSIPVAWAISGDHKVNFNLKFQTNLGGEYEFVSYTASLQDGTDQALYRKQSFDTAEGFSPAQAYHLLSGRSVEKELLGEGGEYIREWKQLDFNDRDQAGNYRIRTIKDDKPFDVAGEVNTLIEKGLIIAPEAQTIIAGICNGNNQYTLLRAHDGERVVYIKADPQNRALKFFDDKMAPVTLMSLIKKEQVLPIERDNKEEKNIDRNKGLMM